MYKIGRAINVYRRLLQWFSQCGYTPRLIEFFPTQNIPSPTDTHAHNFTPKRCKYTHRAERLIHIELSERYGAGPVVCHGGCREAHYELFRARRRDGEGILVVGGEGLEWKEIRKVIVKWVEFVDSAYDVRKGVEEGEEESRFMTPDPGDVKSEEGDGGWGMEVGGNDFHAAMDVRLSLDNDPSMEEEDVKGWPVSADIESKSKFDRVDDDEDMIFDDIVLGIAPETGGRVIWESIVPRGK
ncbi:hypothetical protein HK097_007409 [Rhizophlyctis rosea]|uniref:Bacteriophage T5 Orf172 DNA-binding domain-containing protein n=1 Tax=Rhizophlyctis rosea TaxID=64517 RepID=A0AAD5X4K9_9FUNG|nr:hypothetical protein HK097_007409 [Rhizophlyctis rosea]